MRVLLIATGLVLLASPTLATGAFVDRGVLAFEPDGDGLEYRFDAAYGQRVTFDLAWSEGHVAVRVGFPVEEATDSCRVLPWPDTPCIVAQNHPQGWVDWLCEPAAVGTGSSLHLEFVAPIHEPSDGDPYEIALSTALYPAPIEYAALISVDGDAPDRVDRQEYVIGPPVPLLSTAGIGC